jgi:uncharacterized protein
MAATYGSVSAVTFITAMQYLETHGLPYGGHMAAAMALMESPAIIMAVLLANRLRQNAECNAPAGDASRPAAAPCPGRLASPSRPRPPLGKVLHESFTDGAQLLLLGAMVIGMLTGEAGEAVMAALLGRPVQGHAGLLPARHGSDGRRAIWASWGRRRGCWPMPSLPPLLHARLALAMAGLLGISAGQPRC